MTPDLSTAPKYFRASVARGTETDSPVEREGGMFSAGLIRGVSVITRGEALGHDLWIDADFVSDVTAAINASELGIKARFTHPGMSGDGMGKKLGRLTNARTVGEQTYADLHFQTAAHKTPDGDLAEYVMDLAEETPADFGLSIVFEHDIVAEDDFRKEHSVPAGANDVFLSPDEDNKNGFIHARLATLRSGDVVDEPAANPEGLFSVNDIPAQAESVLSFVLGLSETSPGSIGGIDAERMSGFVARFLDRHNLEVREKDMSNDTPADVDRSEIESQVRSDLKAQAQRFTDAFGEDGAEWFFANKSFEEAQALHIEKLEKAVLERDEQIAKLEQKLASLDTGEKVPADVDAETNGKKKRTFASRINIVGAGKDE